MSKNNIDIKKINLTLRPKQFRMLQEIQKKEGCPSWSETMRMLIEEKYKEMEGE